MQFVKRQRLIDISKKDDLINQHKAAHYRYCILHTSCGKTTPNPLQKTILSKRHRKFTKPIAAPWSGLERRLAACGLDFLFHLKLRDDAKEVAGPEAVASGVSQTSKSLQSQATQANEKRKVACQQSCICGSFEIFGSEGKNDLFSK